MTRTESAPTSLTLGGVTVPMNVRRSPRARRVHLRIDTVEAAVELVLPRWVALREALAFARQNEGWLRRRLAALPARVPFADGIELPLAGTTVTIRHRADHRGPVEWRACEILVGGDAAHVARRVRDFLKAEARRQFVPVLQELASRIGRRAVPLRLTDPQTRWGSCSAEGSVALSWRLVLAPPSVACYVIAHEVAHLVELNHGPRFWRQVALLVGDHVTPRRWLARHGASLLRYG